jgi:hypothetical protein
MVQGRILIQEKLERRILHGLACEWENALAILDPSQKQRIRKPLFRLADMRGQLGTWSAVKGEISLSRALVMNCPWDVVREVLRHEIAHQYAEQEWGPNSEPPHGPLFQKACRLLRADPAASRKINSFYERSAGVLKSNDKTLNRIKKLMALAESTNRHEAEAAMAKAHELIARYNIDLDTQTTSRNFISVFAGKPALRHTRDNYHLANLLQTFYFVQGLWVSAYVITKGKMGRVLEISGTPPNIDIALYVYDYVRQFIDTQWSTYNQDKKLNFYRRVDFAVGIIQGFFAKLETAQRSRRKADETFALVEAGDPLLDGYIAHRYPYTRSFRRNNYSQDDRVLADGLHVGQSLIIAKGITEKHISRRLIPDN